MKRLMWLMVVWLAWGAVCAGAWGEESVDLSGRVQTGEAWVVTAKTGVRIENADGAQGAVKAGGLREDSRKFTATVLEANGGKWTKLDVQFGQCEIDEQAAGAAAAQSVPGALAHKHLTLTRSLKGTGGDGKVIIDTHGAAVPLDVEEDLSAALTGDLMPGKEVVVGDVWSTDQVGALFGAGRKGKVNCKLESIETLADHRRRAVVSVSGSVTRGEEIKGEHGDGEKTATTRFRGTLHVDVASGLIEAASLEGDVELEDGAAAGKEHGKLIYDVRAQWQTLPGGSGVARIEPGTPEDNPLVGATIPSFAGTYRNEKMTIELTDDHADYTGTLKFGGKQLPVKGKISGDALLGTFESNGKVFDFVATLDGVTMRLVSDGSTHILKREEPDGGGDGGSSPGPVESKGATTSPRNPLDQ